MVFPNLPPELRFRLEQLRLHARMTAGAATGRAGSAGVLERVWPFPDEITAERWNEQWEACLARPGCVPQALVTRGGGHLSSPALDALARLGATLLRDDIQQGSPCPFVRPGWSYSLALRAEPYPRRHPQETRGLRLSVMSQIRDQEGEELWSCDASRHLPFEVVPAEVAALLCAQRWPLSVETWA